MKNIWCHLSPLEISEAGTFARCNLSAASSNGNATLPQTVLAWDIKSEVTTRHSITNHDTPYWTIRDFITTCAHLRRWQLLPSNYGTHSETINKSLITKQLRISDVVLSKDEPSPTR